MIKWSHHPTTWLCKFWQWRQKKKGLSVCPVLYGKHIFYEAWLVKSVGGEQQEPQQARNTKKRGLEKVIFRLCWYDLINDIVNQDCVGVWLSDEWLVWGIRLASTKRSFWFNRHTFPTFPNVLMFLFFLSVWSNKSFILIFYILQLHLLFYLSVSSFLVQHGTTTE